MRALAGIRPMGRPRHMSAHRWGAAHVVNPLGTAAVSDAEGRFAACGDYCLGNGLENAVMSGLAAADAVMQFLVRAPGPRAQ